jgi:hypothetical protein
MAPPHARSLTPERCRYFTGYVTATGWRSTERLKVKLTLLLLNLPSREFQRKIQKLPIEVPAWLA